MGGSIPGGMLTALATEPLLRLEEVSAGYDYHPAIEADRMEVVEGERLVLLGPNGAGKTTLLMVLGALLPPFRGRLFYRGAPLTRSTLPAFRRRVGILLQEPHLFRGTALTNVALGLARLGLSRARRREAASAALQLARADHLANRPAHRLSVGERRRVALARTVASSPELLLLDEPLAGVDPPSRRDLLSLLPRVLDGKTLVMVTQSLEEALAVADRLALVIGGRLVQVGTPEEVSASPASQEVERFLGGEVFLPGRVVRAGELSLVALAGGGEVRVAGPAAPGPCYLRVRPETVSLHREPPRGSERNLIAARVVGVREADRGCLAVDLDAGAPLRALVTREALTDLGVRPGERVLAAIKATAVALVSRVR